MLHRLLSLGLVALLLSGCAAGPVTPSDSAPTTGTAAASAAFPVTVAHKFGSTTVTAAPTRVVSVGITEHDVLLQLGVVPVATTDWYGDQPNAVWPWATELLGGARPVVLGTANGFEFEKIAALKPDLIVGTNSGMTAKDYGLLSAIAPTVAAVEGSTDWFSAWDSQVLQIAEALGRKADGQAIVDEVKANYAAAAAAHPDWKGRTATFSQGAPYDGELYVYQDGLNTDFLTDLGFTITPGLEKYSPEAGSQAVISAENVHLLEADVLVFATEDQKTFDELQKFATIGDLPAVKEGRAVYTDGTLAGAIYFMTPLALQYTLDHLTPALEQAVAGKYPRRYLG